MFFILNYPLNALNQIWFYKINSSIRKGFFITIYLTNLILIRKNLNFLLVLIKIVETLIAILMNASKIKKYHSY